MTVKELIEKLKEFDENTQVVVACQESYFNDKDVSSVKKRGIFLNQKEDAENMVIVLNDQFNYEAFNE